MSPWAGGSAVIPTAEKWQTKGGGFYSTFSGEGTLSSDLDYIKRILANYSGTGTLGAQLTYTPGTYVLDFSADSLGSNTDYSSVSGRVQLSSDVPNPAFYPGITKSLKWVDSRTLSDNLPLSIPVSIGPEGGTVGFLFKVSSEGGYDGLRFRVDGVAQNSPWTGEWNWNEVGFSLTPGNHTLTWEFFHDSSAWAGENSAWLAKITVNNAIKRPSAATGNGKRPAVFTFEDAAVPAVLTSATWVNSTDAPISGTRSMRTPALTEADSGNHDLVIDTSSLPMAGIVGFDLKWETVGIGGDTVSIYSGTTKVWDSAASADYTNSRRFDLVVADTTDTLTVRFSKSFGAAVNGAWVDNLSIAYLQEPVTINSEFSGEGTLTTAFAASSMDFIDSDFSGEGSLTTHFSTRKLVSNFSGEGVLFTELEYIIAPQPLEALPLGKLVRYTVSNSAIPVNPAEGSGSTPSVNATYIKGRNPEFALGENFTVDNGAVGSYTGEVVRLGLSKKSDVATISTDTLLTLTNVDMHLYPHLSPAASTWTAARAIEYWTQQCGMFYDKVEGNCAVYASGYGHPNGYAEGAGSSHFYDKVTAGSTSTAVVNSRSVTSFGSDASSMMAQHEALQTRVPVTVGANRKMVFSLGLGLRGTGRTATVNYRFLDGLDNLYVVSIEATSAGTITAKLNGVQASTLTVPAGGNYRVSFSLQRLSDTALVVKLTAHGDDLAGNGELLVNAPAKVMAAALPATLWLISLVHTSAGGSGAEMLRWGTYLSVAKYHPMALPRIQKTLAQSKKALPYVSGFSANVWQMLNEFCSINRMDLSFVEDRLVVGPRANGFNGSVKFSEFSLTAERREKYRQVAVVNKQSKAVPTNSAILWRSDSVYQVAAREVFETTVQTGHSILSVANPEAVTGIWPFPYKGGGGQYVVTGADGYIISPQWWYDNGGKVEVSLTETDGEIAIKITAPPIDTVRAPYRISEGEADRPALYICGAGIVNNPVELHIATGAKKAREGFDSVFESPFIATDNDAYNVAVRMAHEYSAAAAEVSFETTNDFDAPSVLGTYPSGVVFTDNERNFKITDASQTHSKVSGNAIPFTTLAAYKASFPAGATIADEKARHFGRTIKQANIKPLRSNDESA